MLDNQLNTISPSSVVDSLDALFNYIDAEPKYSSSINDLMNDCYELNDYFNNTSNEQHTISYQPITNDQMQTKSSFSNFRSIDNCEKYSTRSLRNSDEIPFNPMEWHVTDKFTRKLRSPKLDEFLYLLLNNLRYVSYSSWLNKAKGLFQIHKPAKVIELWIKVKHRKTKSNLNYEKFICDMPFHWIKRNFIT
ncbi:unnamed protein product, partial [Rotaria sp. Silwood2]